ncbi:MAG: DUF1254 domain-containing protein [Bauldia sp.]|nr:DUF1254 domain-containing protein [Bauldia sp.]
MQPIRQFVVATLLVLVGLGSSLMPASAAEPAQDENLAYAIGIQAYIDGFPMMDLYRTLWETSFDPDRGHDRTLNEFFTFGRLVTSDDDWVITPNNDTIYSRAFLDLRAEPVILEIPPMGDRQFWFPVGDMHHDFDANLSWDTIGSQGGAFAFVAPGWTGVLPEGVQRIEASTPIIWTLGRFAVSGADDLPAAVALQNLSRLVPLSQWGATDVPRPRPDPADFPRFTRDDLTDAKAYFTTMNALLRLMPRTANPMDAALAAWLHEVDMDAATGFDWDALSPPTRRGLERAVTDAHRIIAARMQRAVPIVNEWQIARLDKRISGDPVFAAAAAMLGLLWNPSEVSTYDVAFTDGTGAALDGRNKYILRFAPPPPVNAFWSVTMYSADDQLFVANPIDRYSLGDRTPGTVYGADGSIEIHLQAEEPTDPTERANWLPAPAGPFYLVTRHYSPRAEILTGDWLPPPIERR